MQSSKVCSMFRLSPATVRTSRLAARLLAVAHTKQLESGLTHTFSKTPGGIFWDLSLNPSESHWHHGTRLEVDAIVICSKFFPFFPQFQQLGYKLNRLVACNSVLIYF